MSKDEKKSSPSPNHSLPFDPSHLLGVHSLAAAGLPFPHLAHLSSPYSLLTQPPAFPSLFGGLGAIPNPLHAAALSHSLAAGGTEWWRLTSESLPVSTSLPSATSSSLAASSTSASSSAALSSTSTSSTITTATTTANATVTATATTSTVATAVTSPSSKAPAVVIADLGLSATHPLGLNFLVGNLGAGLVGPSLGPITSIDPPKSSIGLLLASPVDLPKPTTYYGLHKHPSELSSPPPPPSTPPSSSSTSGHKSGRSSRSAAAASSSTATTVASSSSSHHRSSSSRSTSSPSVSSTPASSVTISPYLPSWAVNGSAYPFSHPPSNSDGKQSSTPASSSSSRRSKKSSSGTAESRNSSKIPQAHQHSSTSPLLSIPSAHLPSSLHDSKSSSDKSVTPDGFTFDPHSMITPYHMSPELAYLSQSLFLHRPDLGLSSPFLAASAAVAAAAAQSISTSTAAPLSSATTTSSESTAESKSREPGQIVSSALSSSSSSKQTGHKPSTTSSSSSTGKSGESSRKKEKLSESSSQSSSQKAHNGMPSLAHHLISQPKEDRKDAFDERFLADLNQSPHFMDDDRKKRIADHIRKRVGMQDSMAALLSKHGIKESDWLEAGLEGGAIADLGGANNDEQIAGPSHQSSRKRKDSENSHSGKRTRDSEISEKLRLEAELQRQEEQLRDLQKRYAVSQENLSGKLDDSHDSIKSGSAYSENEDSKFDNSSASETMEVGSQSGSESERSTPESSKRGADGSTDEGSPNKKRCMQLDERELTIPLEHGWNRQTIINGMGRRGIVGEVLYFAPCGKKMKTIPDVMRYLERNPNSDLGRENFSFNTKVNVGHFYEVRNGQGSAPVPLTDTEILEKIEMSRGKRARMQLLARKKREKAAREHALARQIMENKLKRRMELQEMSRRASESRFEKRLERLKQKEEEKKERENKVIERRKEKEQHKLQKQQEKIRMQEQMRKEREMRAQQIIEARNRRQRELEEMRLADAVQRNKEREMKRQQLIIMKEQERERRRQHLLLVKALEQRKKQEERQNKERMKEEKLNEKMKQREMRIHQRRVEMEVAMELKKPVEDMELKKAKPLPVYPRMKSKLAGRPIADCLMTVEFLNNFGLALNLDKSSIPSMDSLERGLLNESEEDVEELMSLVMHLLRFALDDVGVPNPKEAMTKLHQKITEMEMTDTTMSEVLRIFAKARGEKEMAEWLQDKPMEALNPTRKAAILAFLCNELLTSKVVTNEIDKHMDSINNLRRDKWIVEGQLRQLRVYQARKFNKIHKSTDRRLGHSASTSSLNYGDEDTRTSSKMGSDDEDEKEDDEEKDDEEGSGNESDGSSSVITTSSVSSNTPFEPVDETLTREESDKRIEKLRKQHAAFRQKVFRASLRLRAINIGQDRYKRTYWVLPLTSGVYVEGLESGVPEDLGKEPVVKTEREEDDKGEEHKQEDGEKVKKEENTEEDNSLAEKEHDKNEETEKKKENREDGDAYKDANDKSCSDSDKINDTGKETNEERESGNRISEGQKGNEIKDSSLKETGKLHTGTGQINSAQSSSSKDVFTLNSSGEVSFNVSCEVKVKNISSMDENGMDTSEVDTSVLDSSAVDTSCNVNGTTDDSKMTRQTDDTVETTFDDGDDDIDDDSWMDTSAEDDGEKDHEKDGKLSQVVSGKSEAHCLSGDRKSEDITTKDNVSYVTTNDIAKQVINDTGIIKTSESDRLEKDKNSSVHDIVTSGSVSNGASPGITKLSTSQVPVSHTTDSKSSDVHISNGSNVSASSASSTNGEIGDEVHLKVLAAHETQASDSSDLSTHDRENKKHFEKSIAALNPVIQSQEKNIPHERGSNLDREGDNSAVTNSPLTSGSCTDAVGTSQNQQNNGCDLSMASTDGVSSKSPSHTLGTESGASATPRSGLPADASGSMKGLDKVDNISNILDLERSYVSDILRVPKVGQKDTLVSLLNHSIHQAYQESHDGEKLPGQANSFKHSSSSSSSSLLSSISPTSSSRTTTAMAADTSSILSSSLLFSAIPKLPQPAHAQKGHVPSSAVDSSAAVALDFTPKSKHKQTLLEPPTPLLRSTPIPAHSKNPQPLPPFHPSAQANPILDLTPPAAHAGNKSNKLTSIPPHQIGPAPAPHLPQPPYIPGLTHHPYGPSSASETLSSLASIVSPPPAHHHPTSSTTSSSLTTPSPIPPHSVSSDLKPHNSFPKVDSILKGESPFSSSELLQQAASHVLRSAENKKLSAAASSPASSSTQHQHSRLSATLLSTPVTSSSTETTVTSASDLMLGYSSGEQGAKSSGDTVDHKLWFSILPRMPCDEQSLTQPTQPSTSYFQPLPSASTSPLLSASSSLSAISTYLTSTPSNLDSLLPLLQSNPNLLSQESLLTSLQLLAQPLSSSPSPTPCSTPGPDSSAEFKVPPPPDSSGYSDPWDLLRAAQGEAKPIPKYLQHGWWRIFDIAQLKGVMPCTLNRGIREKALQRSIHRYLDYARLHCTYDSEKGEKDPDADDNEDNNKQEEQKQGGKSGRKKGDGKKKSEKKEDVKIEEKEPGTSTSKNDSNEESSESGGDASADVATKIKTEVDDRTSVKTETDDNKGEEKQNCDEDGENKAEVEEEIMDYVVPDEPESWSIKVMHEIEMAALEEVEALEERIFQASLQTKLGWRPNKDINTMLVDRSVAEVADNESYPLDVAISRLLELEANIERRYLKPPLIRSVQLNMSNISNQSDGDAAEEEDIPPGLLMWRQAVTASESPAQLSLCTQMLAKSISWEKSIMRVTCQICRKDDNEAELLLCDGCDKGYHTYCFKPKMENIPEGDWYCYECVSKASGTPHCVVCGQTGGRMVSCRMCPRYTHLECVDPPLPRMPKRWQCSNCLAEKGNSKRSKKRKESLPTVQRITITKLVIKEEPRDEEEYNAELAGASTGVSSPTDGDADRKGSGPLSNDKITAGAETSTADKKKRKRKEKAPETATAAAPSPPKKKEKKEKPAVKKERKPREKKGATEVEKAKDAIVDEKRVEKGVTKDVTACGKLLTELEKHEDGWPFLKPVNKKQFPSYKKYIKFPMDFSSARAKLRNKEYKHRQEFAADMRLIFNNCETFNEDDSEVGHAGYSMRQYFERRWLEIFPDDAP